MGIVFRARHRGLNRIVALKMILAGRLADEAHIERFFTEARAAARLQHPGIVPVYEAGQHDGQHFLAMAFVEGSNLGERVRNGALPAEQAATLIQAAAEAVHYAHGQGVIHRDLKPTNILLDRTGRPHISDFGLAKDATSDGGSTSAGMVLGTPDYMAPEQSEGRTENVGPAADIYSLGATLYHLLTGQPPFRATALIESFHQLIDREPARLRSLNPSIPKDLEIICLTCLQRDPRRRYGSAAALAQDLGRWLRCEPICARSVRRREKLWLWCRRKPALAALLATLVAALLGIMVTGIEAYKRHRMAVLVEQLLLADTADVPEIAGQLAAYGGRAGPLLHDAFDAAAASGDEKKQLHAALALREFERGQVDYLRDRASAVFQHGDELASRGDWKQASNAFDRAIALYPDDLSWLHRSAILRLHVGDVDGYRQRCHEMLDRFGGTDQPELAHTIALTLFAVPDPVGEPNALLALARVTARSGNAMHVRSLAAAYFRLGSYAEARRLLKLTLPARIDGYSKANTLFFLAMTHHHLGDTKEAARALAEGVTEFDRAAAGIRKDNYGPLWRRWITVSFVRREAEALIGTTDAQEVES
jgi:tetratricopeptide (TPR) repeat protein/predicted Ser/Thr protein kinase